MGKPYTIFLTEKDGKEGTYYEGWSATTGKILVFPPRSGVEDSKGRPDKCKAKIYPRGYRGGMSNGRGRSRYGGNDF